MGKIIKKYFRKTCETIEIFLERIKKNIQDIWSHILELIQREIDNILVEWIIKLFWYMVLWIILAWLNILIIDQLINMGIKNVAYYIIYPIFVDWLIFTVFLFLFGKKNKTVKWHLIRCIVWLCITCITIKYLVNERPRLVYLIEEYWILTIK